MIALKNRTIILPIDEIEYHQIVNNKKMFSKKLSFFIEKYPELFPVEIALGYHFVGYSKNALKHTIVRRLIRIKTLFNTYEDYLIHPCFVLPYLKGITQEVSQGLGLRKYNVPYHAIASLCGRNAMYWYELEVALSQYNIVGTTLKRRFLLPENLLMDEHHTKLFKDKIYICTTVGQHCFLGVDISENISYEGLKIAYNSFKIEAQIIAPNYTPYSINIDGFPSTKKAIQSIFPTSGILRCFLHSFLKIRNCGTKAYDLYFTQVAKKIWSCYYAPNRRSFAQRIAALKKWTIQFVPDSPFKVAILKLCEKKRFYDTL